MAFHHMFFLYTYSIGSKTYKGFYFCVMLNFLIFKKFVERSNNICNIK